MATNRLVEKKEVAAYARFLMDQVLEAGGKDAVLDVRAELREIVKTVRDNKDLLAALTEEFHDLRLVVRLVTAGLCLYKKTAVAAEDQPCRFRAGQLQTQLHKIAVVVTQPGKVPAGLTEGIVTQLCVDTAKTIGAPHRAATVFDGHDRAILCVL